MRRAGGVGSRVDTALLAVCVFLALVLKASSDPVRDRLAALLRSTVLAPLISLQASTEKARMALDSHDAMIMSRDSALLLNRRIPELQAENEQMRRMFVLGSRLDWGFIPALALREPGLGSLTSVTLTAGADAGVKRLSPVVSADGLVGIIQTVDAKTSVASLWTDEKTFGVSAMAEDGSATGIVSPHLGSGARRYLLELRNVQFRYTLQPGTRIVATGFGGVFPAMVPIGTVIEELEQSGGWARTYLVRPAVMPQDITYVMILTPERSAAGVPGVWDTQSSRDSTARAIVARGDSIARLRYEAAVKAAADSALMRMKAAGTTADTTTPPAGKRGPPGL